MKAELKALLRGLAIAKERGVPKPWIKSDSMVLVGMLRGEIAPNPEHRALIEQCKRKLKEDSCETTVTHCFCEADKIADMLANIGVSLNTSRTIF